MGMISASLLPEFDHEMANTRKTLERVPDNKLDFKPHPKSMSMLKLASHLATINDWVTSTIEADSFDFAPVGKEPYKMPETKNRAEMLAAFDRLTANARKLIAGASDEHLMKTWSLQAGGHTIFSMPRVAVLRSFIMNHTIHHRAQLGVYLRLNDILVPSIYGPSADEGNM